MTQTGYAPGIGATNGTAARIRAASALEKSAWRADPLATLLRWAFLVVVFSVPLEAADLGITHRYLSVTKLVGYGFLVLALLKPGLCFRHRPIPFAIFAAYTVFLGAISIADSGPHPEITKRLLTLVQLLGLFLISYNLMRNRVIANQAIIAYVAACILVALLAVLGIATTSREYGEYDRVSVFSNGENTVAAVLSLGLLSLFGLMMQDAPNSRTLRALYVPPLALLAVGIMQTGSRGAMAAVCAGIAALTLQGGSGFKKIRGILLAGVFMLLFLAMIYTNEMNRVRWTQALNQGRLSQRERIFPAAWNMFLERPVLGWGPVQHTRELGRRLGEEILDPHNLYLWLLTETGVIGAVIFLAGVVMCVRAAWRFRRRPGGMIPLILLVTVAVVNLAGTYHLSKWFWLVIAYALASGSRATVVIPSSARVGYADRNSRIGQLDG